MAVVIGYGVMFVGLWLSLYSTWILVRGPFAGYPLPSGELILLATGGFVVGVVLFAWGVQRVLFSSGSERPDLDEQHDHTMDWIRR